MSTQQRPGGRASRPEPRLAGRPHGAPIARPAGRRACILLPDANILLDHPQLGRWRADGVDLTLLLLERIAREVRGLGQRPDAAGAAARRAALELSAWQVRGPGAPAPPGAPRVRFWRGADGASQTDAHLVAEAAAAARRHPEAAVAVVSRDAGVWERAARAGVYCVLARGRFDNAGLARAVREALAAHGG